MGRNQTHTPNHHASSSKTTQTSPAPRRDRGLGNSGLQEQLGLNDPFKEATAGGGGQLPFRTEMEQSFGEDFSDVKAYFGRKGQMERLGAGAAARDKVVVFASASPSKEQVAHELTHIVQRRKGSSGGDKNGVSNPNGGAEGEASQLAADVVAGKEVNVKGSAGPEIHRDFLGIGSALGDAFDMREDEARLDAQEDLAEFRARNFTPLEDYKPSSGIGMYDVAFNAATGQQTVTLKVGYNFVAGNQAAVAPGFRPAEFQWTVDQQNTWKARYQREVSAQWSAQYQFKCTRQYWESLLTNVTVQVIEDSADPHFVLTVSKYPDDAGMAQSSICPPGTHHDPVGGNTCPDNTADTAGHIPNGGSGKFDNNDLRPEQKLDWGNAASTVNFRSGSSTLNAAGNASVQAIVAQLQADPTARVELTGHSSNSHRNKADATTGQIENMDIARARSVAVKAALVAAGISASRVQVHNAGEQGAGAGNEWCRVDAQVGNHQMQSPALHETGHMLGLGDEYPQTGAGLGTPVEAGYDAMIRSTTGEVVTRARDESAMSMGSTVKPWHYSSFMESLRTISGVQEWSI